MRNSYVGIISKQGLESLHEEDPDTVTFLHRRIEQRRLCDDVVFWAVLDVRFAAVIQMEIESGNHPQALVLLQTLADEVGRILPELSDSVSVVSLE